MIWLIGGTKDSRDFLEKFLNKDNEKNENKENNIIVSTATDYGAKLLEQFRVSISSEKMDKVAMLDFVKKYKISKIVDTSHPYAYEVSQNAMEISQKEDIPYYRFEREEIELRAKQYSKFENIEDLLQYIENLEGNILVTLGSNHVPLFRELKNLSRCYFRILPKWDMVKRCEENGILPKNIVAMQGPFTMGMNFAMMEQLHIQYLVTKKAGDTGGERDKISACDAMGVEVIYLEKKELKYTNCYSNLEELIETLKNPSK